MAIDVTLEYSTASYASRTNTTVSKPTNTSDGDFLLAGFGIESDTTITAPSGWTEITTLDCAAVAYNLKVYYKRASSEPSSWTWTHASASTCAFVKRLTGVIASGDPEDCTRSTADPGFVGGPVTAPSITTTTDGAALMQISSLYYNSGFTGSGDDLTQRINDTHIALNSDLQSSAGASGTKDVNFTGSERPLTILIALTPAGGGGGITIPVVVSHLRQQGIM